MITKTKISAKFMLYNPYGKKIYQKLEHDNVQCLFMDAAFIVYQYDLEYKMYNIEVVK